MTNLVDGCKKALKECNVKEENIFETSIPGAYELPLSARFLALSGTVDAIVTAGVLIKGEVGLKNKNGRFCGSAVKISVSSNCFFLVCRILSHFSISSSDFCCV